MKMTILKLPGLDDYFVQEAFNVLRTNIQFCGQDVKVIALTSCNSNEGKSVLSLHIGHSLAELGKRVLVIDADMRKSVMASRNTDVRSPKGLSEVLTGQEKVDDAIHATQFENMHILFSGQYPPNPVDLLNGPYFTTLIDSLKAVYDYIIVDTPPLGMVIDAAVVSAKCDSAIMVIGGPNVRCAQAQEVINQMKKSGCNVLGVILNNSRGTRKPYYKYKRGAKHYDYGYYSSTKH